MSWLGRIIRLWQPTPAPRIYRARRPGEPQHRWTTRMPFGSRNGPPWCFNCGAWHSDEGEDTPCSRQLLEDATRDDRGYYMRSAADKMADEMEAVDKLSDVEGTEEVNRARRLALACHLIAVATGDSGPLTDSERDYLDAAATDGFMPGQERRPPWEY